MSQPTQLSKTPQTPLDDILTITPTPKNPTLFTAHVTPDWCGVWSLFGGISAALIHSTARLYSQTQHPENPQPDPLVSHIQFLYSVPPGTVRLFVSELKSGARVSVVQILVQAPVPPSSSSSSQPSSFKDEWRTCALGIVTQGNLGSERGLSIPVPLPFPKEEIPDRVKGCVLGGHPDWYLAVAPVVGKFESWVPRFGESDKDKVVEAYGNPRFGREVREGWVRRKDGKNWDVLSLGLLCDFLEGAPGNFSPSRQDMKADIWYPTLCLTTEIKSDPKGKEWLYTRARANMIKNGRFDTLLLVVDEDARLMAVAKHVSLVTQGRFAGNWKEIKSVYKL